MSTTRATAERPSRPSQPERRDGETRGRGPAQPPGEVNGPKGPEPTRFGDWEKGGRCSDF